MISVILPVHNEVGSLRDVYSSLKRVLFNFGRPFEIIFVDDGSTDGSTDVLRSIKRSDGAVTIIELEKRCGQSNALQAGFDNAKGAAIVTLDSDMENDPVDIPSLLNKLDEGYDIVCGKRILRPPGLNEFLSRSGNAVFRFLFSTPVSDMACTLRAYRKDILDGLVIRGSLHRYLPVLLHFRGAKIGELDVKYTERKHGKSKYGIISRLFETFYDLIQLMFFRERILKDQERAYKIKVIWEKTS